MPNELSSPDSDLLYEADYLAVFIKLKSFQASHWWGVDVSPKTKRL